MCVAGACLCCTMLTYMQTCCGAVRSFMSHSVFDSIALIDHLSPANLEWPPNLVTIRIISVASRSVGLNAQLAGAQLCH